MQPTTKKKPTFLILIGTILAICVFCIVASFAMDALGLLPETTPFPTNPPAPTSTIPPTISPAQTYFDEYGGRIEVYNEILSLNDCVALQEKFNIASDNNTRAEPGTAEFKWTLGYMTAADERMKFIGCYSP